MNENFLQCPQEMFLTSFEAYQKLFPVTNYKNAYKLRLTDISLYSMTNHYESKELIEYAIKLLKDNNINYEKLNALDIGCNIGGTLYYLSKYFNQTTGIEFEPLHVQICHDNLNILLKKKNFSIIQGDVSTLFNNIKLNIKNIYEYKNNDYILLNNDSKFINSKIIYIGTPFVSMSFGNLRIDHLLYKIINKINPLIMIVQLPGKIYSKIVKDS